MIGTVVGVVVAIVGITVVVAVSTTWWDPHFDFAWTATDETASSLHVVCSCSADVSRCRGVARSTGMCGVVSVAM